MKKAIKWVGLFVVAVVCMVSFTLLTACKDNKTPEAKEYTVTFYDGTTVLDTQTVKEGEKATKWNPTKEGYTFVDWYATPNFGHLFEFDQVITENKSAFAQWASATQSVDTREYYIVGSGTSPILMNSNWGKVIDETMKMTKASDKNEYTFTTDLQVGDLFQFAINEEWHNQRGVGYLTSTKLENGTEAFSGAGTIGDNSAYRLNIKCEFAGNYTFTLTTHPDDDTYETTHPSYTEANKEAFNINSLDTISWVRNGDVSATVDVVTDYYIKGSGITNWKDMYNAATKMTNTNGVYTLSVYLKENEEFMFTSLNTIGTEVATGTEYLRATNLDEASKAFVDQKPSANMVAKASGTYTFTYTKATDVLSAVFDANQTPVATDYYIDGTFAEGVDDWSGYCFKPEFKLVETEAGSGVYEIKNVALKANSEIIIQAFKAGSTERGEWGTEGYNGLGSYNYTYLYNGGTAFSAVGNGNNNIKVLTAGNYDITFDSYAKMITMVEHIESNDTLDIYIKGENINSWSHGWSTEYLFTISEDETQYEYVLTVEEGKAVSFGCEKHPKGEKQGYGDYLGVSTIGTSGDANDQFVPEAGSNFTCSTAGRYKVVYTIATGKLDFYALPNA
ncbi:MAG: InlB B-repeat-containing protein [Anaeroplasmataceae bacterium]|nr:InlB B-repeat-containing protein [Anaeroplasmataceae bacterium]